MKIFFTYSTSPTITWWDASTGGNQLNTGSALEAVGTSVLPTATPGTYTVYAQSENGVCIGSARTAASIVVNSNSSTALTAQECNEYDLNGTLYSSTGIYTQTLTNANGCDSTITLDLTIINSTTASITEASCETYTSPSGLVYTLSGVYMDTIPNAAGCDSVITIDLTINSPISADISVESCGVYFDDQGGMHTEDEQFTLNFTTIDGCDSLVNVDLTIVNVDQSVSVTGVTMTSNQVGASYQWINCVDNAAIPGAISSELHCHCQWDICSCDFIWRLHGHIGLYSDQLSWNSRNRSVQDHFGTKPSS